MYEVLAVKLEFCQLLVCSQPEFEEFVVLAKYRPELPEVKLLNVPSAVSVIESVASADLEIPVGVFCEVYAVIEVLEVSSSAAFFALTETKIAALADSPL